MGDDLYIAREFSNAALADISAIGAMEPLQSAHDMRLKLAQLQNGAKRARARAIYQSAQIAIDALHPKAAKAFDMQLSALSKLVSQYAQGLHEVEAASEGLQDPQEKPSAPPPLRAEQAQDIEASRATAQTTLTDVLSLARPDEITGLQALIDYDPQPEPSKPVGLKIDRQAQTLTPENPIALIPLEYVLRDAIQDALSIARISGKTISVSYDVNQKHIESQWVKALEMRLCEGLRALILQSLPQNDIGHLDINLRGQDMVIYCKHKQPRLLPQGLTCHEVSKGCEVILPLYSMPEANSGAETKKETAPTLQAEPNQTDESPNIVAQKSAPMITAATEAQLRAQLGALLDGQEQQDGLQADNLHMDDNIIVMTDDAATKQKSDSDSTGEMGASL